MVAIVDTRETNRLTDGDRAAIASGIAWTIAHADHPVTIDGDHDGLMRAAARSIGCVLADLRQSEIYELGGMVDTAIIDACPATGAEHVPDPGEPRCCDECKATLR